ncbi:50S ribosomal protein L28 [Candidatus Amesbacteria bacterium]|nr:50S ribosomal protein L28 [Candidatus Amesbacteria bacterium]
MAYRCDNCGKGTQYGETGKHHRGVAGGRWLKRAQKTKRVWRPNLHSFKGKKYCTKCLRKLRSRILEIKAPAISS